MNLDWFTIAAQLINFLILVGLLRKYLYRPVLKAVDEREKKIAAQVNNAMAAERAAQEEKTALKEKQADLDSRSSALMERAKTDADAFRDRLIAEARQSVELQRTQWQAALSAAQEDAAAELTRELQDAVMGVARKFLGDLADANLEARMTAVFLDRLRGLDAAQRTRLAAAADGESEITIRSAVTMNQAENESIRNVLTGIIGRDNLRWKFETDPAMVCGIGLYLTGYKLEWSVADYLDELNSKITGNGQAMPVETEAYGKN